ncbi:MAG: response regulator, partial [Deltaproteobacteria bacterium]|nr:response regulator [Deltaproteobacteria bacterium]
MKKKLLIIEDETSLAKQLKWALDKEYAVTIASAPRQAKSLVATGEYPVITLDLGLPPVPSSPEEGFKLLEEIRSVTPHSKVIVITGNSEEENAVRAIRLGAVDFCAKPIDVRILEIILSRSFHLYSIEEANRRLIHHCGTAGMLCGMLG